MSDDEKPKKKGPKKGVNLTPQEEIERAQRWAKVLELKVLGHTWEEIAKRTGYSDRSGARKAYYAALSAQTKEPAHAAIALELERYEKLMNVAMLKASKGDLKGVMAALAVSKRKSEMLGLDAPTKQMIKATVSIDDLTADQLESRRLEIVRLLKKKPEKEALALPAPADDDDAA